VHGAVASSGLNDASLVAAVLADWRTAPVSAGVRVTLGLLEKLTLTPDAVTPDDMAAPRAAGVSDEAIEDAIAICALFNTMDRIADALDFTPPTPEQAARGAASQLARGYRM
jgi:uncharacterized peroxidase-related enzyme